MYANINRCTQEYVGLKCFVHDELYKELSKVGEIYKKLDSTG